MKVNFFGANPAYHEARRRFVFKGNPPPQESRPSIPAAVEGPQAVLSGGAGWATPKDMGRAAAPSRLSDLSLPRNYREETNRKCIIVLRG